MTTEQILEWCELFVAPNVTLEFPEVIFSEITTEAAVEISKRYGANTMMMLPLREQEFFAWVRENDEPVWNDLWSGSEIEPYTVSIAFLPALLDPSRGFPICDLETVDNYFFVPSLLQSEDAKNFIEAVKVRFTAKQKLTVEQLLALECSFSPIDIWHFAWHHSIGLERAKQAVTRLEEDNILVHLKKAEEIAAWME